MFTKGVLIPMDQLIWRYWQKIAKIANFVQVAKIANVHPRGVNTNGQLIWRNWQKIAKIANFVQVAKIANVHPRVVNTNGQLIWRNWQKIAKIAYFGNIVNCGALSPNLPFLSSRAFLGISGDGIWWDGCTLSPIRGTEFLLQRKMKDFCILSKIF